VNRRAIITLLSGAAAWPLAARAQQPAKIPRIGIIDNAPIWDHFRQGLRDHGYVEGRDVILEYRMAEGKPNLLAAAAADLVRLPVDVIATFGSPASRAAQQATKTIPIVAISVGDPVRIGLVASLARPGGNITGNTNLGPDVVTKRLQLFKELIPSVSRLAFLWNPDNGSNVAQVEETRTALPALQLTLISVEVRSVGEFDDAFSIMMRARPDALQMTNDPLHQVHVQRVIDFVGRNRLPSMYLTRENVLAGGLVSYGASSPDLFRRGAGYVHRILQGTKPADLPVEQPVKFELAVNMKTAKAIGLSIPESFLARADEVIE
jgi:putative tryptophan/tyrosine transport system substrate-binding protein